MTFPEAIRSGIKNYGSSSGRACRSEFWYWTLFQALVMAGAMFPDTFFFPELTAKLKDWGPFSIVSYLALVLPTIAVTARRLHDVGRSGWWMFLPATIVGIIPYVYWMFKKGDSGNNIYGADPLSPAAANEQPSM